MYNLTQFKTIDSLQEFFNSQEFYDYIYPPEWLYTMIDSEYEYYTEQRSDELYLALEAYCIDMNWDIDIFELP